MEFKNFILQEQNQNIQDAVHRLFGDQIFQIEEYAGYLVTSGIDRGLLGPREASKIWTRHILNCAVIQECVPKNAVLADIGSGAGLPGLTLAIARPDLKIILIEPLKRRTVWLEEVVDDLKLKNVDIMQSRAEEIKDRIAVDMVTARAVTSLKNLINISFPLLQSFSNKISFDKNFYRRKLIAIKGSSVFEEIKAANMVLAKHDLKSTVKILGEDFLEDPTRIVEVYQ